MSGKKLALLLLMLLAVSAAISTGVVLAKDSGNASGYQVIRDSYGSTKLRVTTDAATDGMWLGVTLYPANTKIGSSQVLALKRGQNSHDINISPSLNYGTFEVAVWTKKLTKKECGQNDEACRKNGYKLTGMTSYLWGYLN
jgi:hypothetical protein